MERASRAADAGVVDQNVETVKGAFDAFAERFGGMQIGDVAFDYGTLAAAVQDGGSGFVQRRA